MHKIFTPFYRQLIRFFKNNNLCGRSDHKLTQFPPCYSTIHAPILRSPTTKQVKAISPLDEITRRDSSPFILSFPEWFLTRLDWLNSLTSWLTLSVWWWHWLSLSFSVMVIWRIRWNLESNSVFFFTRTETLQILGNINKHLLFCSFDNFLWVPVLQHNWILKVPKLG